MINLRAGGHIPQAVAINIHIGRIDSPGQACPVNKVQRAAVAANNITNQLSAAVTAVEREGTCL